MATLPPIPQRYTGPAIAFHWIIAALIACNLLLIWTIDSFPKDWERPAINLHKSIGITVLLLAVMRVVWRQTHTPPPLPASYPVIEKKGAHVAHILLYVIMLGLPFTGWMYDSAFKAAAAHPLTLYGVIPWFRIGAIANLPQPEKEHWHSVFFQWHGAFAYALYVLFVLHVAGALKHQLWDHKPELQRMLP